MDRHEKSNPLGFYDELIHRAEHGQSLKSLIHKGYDPLLDNSCNPEMRVKIIVWQETLQKMDFFRNKAHQFKKEKEMLFYFNRIETHLRRLIYKLNTLRFEGDKIILNSLNLLLDRIILCIKTFESSKNRNNSKIWPEIQTLREILEENHLKCHFIETWYGSSLLSSGHLKNKSQFTENFNQHYIDLSVQKKQMVMQTILQQSLTTNQKEFSRILSINYNILKSLEKIDTKTTGFELIEKDSFLLTEIKIRNDIQKLFTTPLLHFIVENFGEKLSLEKSKIPGREKTRSALNRIALTTLHLAQKDSGYYPDIKTDSQLARYLEENYLYEINNPMKNIRQLISHIRTKEKDHEPSLNKIITDFKQNGIFSSP